MNGLSRRLAPLALATAAVPGAAWSADPPAFDLPGPGLTVTVTRGDVTLPIGEVPGLAAGDRIAIAADLPEDQRAKYLLLSAFLSGATNPPPKKWVVAAETWAKKDKDRHLALTVPEGARQLVLFLVPETGGAEASITDAVRGRPGEFVRATQGLNQASLDRSRLNAFMAAIRAQENTHPEFLRTIAPTLARSLAIKLNEDCLGRAIEMQAACLVENRDALVLPDFHSSSMTETLIGAPTDLAMQLSYTREAGLGYYSAYIAVVRDLARVFGAFNNPQFRYLPTLASRTDENVALLLNTAPSFSKPKSVLVTGMPSIGADSAPRLRNTATQPLCGARPGLVLPIDGAPLIYSTGYAHDMTVRLTGATGAPIDIPVTARADRGGYVLAKPLPAGALGATATAKLTGRWGFDPLDGPDFDLQFPGAGGWKADSDQLVVGRDNILVVTGGAASCVAAVTLRGADGVARSMTWKQSGPDTIALTLPLKDAAPGDYTVQVQQHGAGPVALPLKAFVQASRIDAVEWHRGDRTVAISGQRLDNIAAVEIGGARFDPGDLTRTGDTDRLAATASQALVDPGEAPVARVRLKDGRTLQRAVTIAAPRPAATILTRSPTPKEADRGISLTTTSPDVLPDRSRLAFSLRAGADTRFTAQDAIEIATADNQQRVTLSPGADVRVAAPDTLVATLDPARLGTAAAGPLRYRLMRGDLVSDWQPLVQLARLPRIERVECPSAPSGGCTLRGGDLFLIDAISAGAAMEGTVTIPAGYTAAALAAPRPADGKLYLRLRDVPDAVFVLPVP